jgi:DNA-binding GntR family transcriptional regulator
MHPQIQRPEPVWRQLVSFYREQIKLGELRDGERLPPVREIAETWKVAHTTVAKSLRQLAAEGLIVTSNQGSQVTWGEHHTFSPRDRLRAMSGPRRQYPHGMSRIVSSELVTAPDYVAERMSLELGSQVIRRERITVNDRADTPVQRSISWLPSSLADAVPELLVAESIPGGTVGIIRERTGRQVQLGSDSYRQCALRADEVVAAALQVTEGSPVLRGENIWTEADGTVLEFGEYTIPEGIWVGVSD